MENNVQLSSRPLFAKHEQRIWRRVSQRQRRNISRQAKAAAAFRDCTVFSLCEDKIEAEHKANPEPALHSVIVFPGRTHNITDVPADPSLRRVIPIPDISICFGL